MTLQRQFETAFFLTVANTRCDYLDFQSHALSHQYGIPKQHIEEKLARWHRDELIHLTAYNGNRGSYQALDAWDGDEPFFAANSNGNYFRVRLLADGAELAESLQKQPIGFAAGR